MLDAECGDKGIAAAVNLLNDKEQQNAMIQNIKLLARHKAADRIVDEIDKITLK